MQIRYLYDIFLRNRMVTTDSRKIRDGIIYFALQGEKFNGNLFAKDALDKGASVAVIDDPQYKTDDRMLLVNDALIALQQLANYHRMQLKFPVLAITGTNGKTTTKELVNAVLMQKYNVLATEGNLNNHIGVPLTLLSIQPEHDFAVVEMGANHPFEIKQLCDIAAPDYGIITNIGKAHLEGFGGIEGVIKTKKELYDFLELHHGTIFYNAENALFESILSEFNTSKVSYGLINGGICNGVLTAADPFLQAAIRCNDQSGFSIHSQLIGKYNFENILAAIAVGKFFGVSNDAIKIAVDNYKPMNNRSQYMETSKNKLFVDCYNANPSSMELALLNFFAVQGDNKLVILGDMLELGPESEIEHQKIIALLIREKCKALLVGPVYNRLAGKNNIQSFETVSDLNVYLLKHTMMNHTILLKGSRGIQLEKAIDNL